MRQARGDRVLHRRILGWTDLRALSPTEFRGQVILGAGIVKGLFDVEVTFVEAKEPVRLRLTGAASGPP